MIISVSPQVDPLLPTSHQVYVQSGIILPCGILVGPITSASRPFTVTWQVVNSTGRFTLFTASYNLPGEEPINMTTGIYEYNAEDYSLGVSNFIGITENLTFQCKISPSTNPVSRTINVTLLYGMSVRTVGTCVSVASSMAGCSQEIKVIPLRGNLVGSIIF